jgi:hypothetical protein
MDLFKNFGINITGENVFVAPTITFIKERGNDITVRLRNNGPVNADIKYGLTTSVNSGTTLNVPVNGTRDVEITGLTPNSSYVIYAQSVSAVSQPSGFAPSIITNISASTTAARGQRLFTSSTTWVAPIGVTSVSVVCVGGGGGGMASADFNNGGGSSGGGGGALAWRNSIAVTPGASYTVTVGAGGSGGRQNNYTNPTAGGTSSFINTSAEGGRVGGVATVSSFSGQGGGSGGRSSIGGQYRTTGGGGAGGYSGNGGRGGEQFTINGNGFNGAGGAGGGGSMVYNNLFQTEDFSDKQGGHGGGVGLLGQSNDGTGGVYCGNTCNQNFGVNGGAGSGGGGSFAGGGAPGMLVNSGVLSFAASGTQGAVRIIWGTGRAYPNTNTHDV